MSDIVEFRSTAGEHYENDRRQALMFIGLLAFAAILSVVLILWAVM